MEVSQISDPLETEDRFKSLGKKLAKKIGDAQNDAQKILSKGADKHSTKTYLPEDFSNYLMSLKLNSNKPVSILPSNLFKKPLLIGREKYFSRLASELILSGLAYQRVHLKPLKRDEITNLFFKYRPWWDCDKKDVQHAINILEKAKIIKKTEQGFLFEPMTLSIDIQEFFSIILTHLSPHGEIPIKAIHTYISWDQIKIERIINILKENGIVLVDESLDVLFFPDYATR